VKFRPKAAIGKTFHTGTKPRKLLPKLFTWIARNMRKSTTYALAQPMLGKAAVSAKLLQNADTKNERPREFFALAARFLANFCADSIAFCQ
jgi:hypothetical protein